MKQQSLHDIVHAVFVGPPAVGKSCLLTGFTSEYQTEQKVIYIQKQYNAAGKIIRFSIWNIPASLTFQDKTAEYCKKADIVACVYSASNQKSFSECQNMIEMLIKQNKLRYDAKLALISNKNDLQQHVLSKQGCQLACILNGNNSNNGIANNFFEVSAKSNPTTLQELCKGFYQILKDNNIKGNVEIQQSQDPAPPQQLLPIVSIASLNANETQKHYQICNVLMMGQHQSGKSSILRRYTNDQFTDEYEVTIGVEFAIKQMEVLGTIMKMQIFDVSGSKKFIQSMYKYIKVSHFILLVYDSSNIQSLANLSTFINNINNNNRIFSKQSIYIIASKIDKQQLISIQNGQKFAQENNCSFVKTSSLLNIGIFQLFNHLVDIFINNLLSTSQALPV